MNERIIDKIPNEKCEGCGLEIQGVVIFNSDHDLYLCEGCNERMPDEEF